MLDLLVARELESAAYTASLAEVAVLADVKTVRTMLDHGADVNAYDPLGGLRLCMRRQQTPCRWMS